MPPEPELPPVLTPQESAVIARKRRGRNIAMLVALIAIVVLFYAISIAKLANPGLGAH
jgi:hypothetical protein